MSVAGLVLSALVLGDRLTPRKGAGIGIVLAGLVLLTYVPVYLAVEGTARLASASATALWTEVLVQGAIAGAGTLFAYATMVRLLGPARAAVFPALAPGLAALMAWPVLGHVPTVAEAAGLAVVMSGLILAVTTSSSRRTA